MFRRLNTKTLLLFVGALVAVLLVSKYLDSKKGESNFRNQISNFDSSKVDEIRIYPLATKHEEIKLTQKGDSWELTGGKLHSSADTAGIHFLIHELCDLRPTRLAATDKQSWKDYSVDDSLGTRIKILSSGKILADLVIGKFSYSQQTRGGISYVRLSDEKEVYAIDGFLPMLCNRGFETWRNKILFNSDFEKWTELVFEYPADSGFTLKKQNGKWLLNGMPCDSAKTKEYLNSIAHLNGTAFLADSNKLGNIPFYSVRISGTGNTDPFNVLAFPSDSLNEFLITSDLNPGADFSSKKGNLSERIFVSSDRFRK